MAEPFIGTADIKKDFTLTRSMFFEFFISYEPIRLNVDNFDKYFVLPEDVKVAINSRFENQASPYAEYVIESHKG